MDAKTPAKMMKIGVFAARYGISDRHARRLVAEHESDLVGHYEKRGAAGTFIDDVAADFLRDKLKNPIEILPAETFETPEDLRREIETLKKDLNEKNEQLAAMGMELYKVGSAPALLEAANSEKLALQEKNDNLIAQNGSLTAQNAGLSADKANLEEKLQTISSELKTASADLKEAEDRNHLLEQQVDRMKKATLWQRIRGWKG